MRHREIEKSACRLIAEGRFAAIPPMLEQAATRMDAVEKQAFIAIVEQVAENIDITSPPQKLEAAECWLLAAKLAEQLCGEADDRALAKLRFAAHVFASPTNSLTDLQAQASAATAVELLERYIAVLQRSHPDRGKDIADAMGLRVFCAWWGDRVDETEFNRLHQMHQETLDAIRREFGERSREFSGELRLLGTFLARHGRKEEGRRLRDRARRIAMLVERESE